MNASLDMHVVSSHADARTAALLAALEQVQAVVEFDLDGRVLRANDLFLELMGYTADEVQGQHHRIFCPQELVYSAAYRTMWEGLRAGEVRKDVFEHIGKSGQRVWLDASYNPVRDSEGRMVGTVKLATDVTGRRMQQADYEGKIAAIDRVQAVIEFDLAGRILWANDNFLTVFGYALEDIVGKHHRIFCEPDHAGSNEYARFWDRLGRGEFNAGRYRRMAKDGRSVWIQASYNPILDAAGEPCKVVKFATDITRDMLAAAEAKGKVDAIALSQAVIEFDMQGNVLSANPNFLRTMGYTLAEIQGRHHSLFCEPGLAQSQTYRDFWADLAEGKFQSARYRRIGKHGAEVWIQATYNPILGPDGLPYKIVKYAVDVTAQVLRDRAVEQKVGDITRVMQAMTESIKRLVRGAERSSEIAAQTQREAG